MFVPWYVQEALDYRNVVAFELFNHVIKCDLNPIFDTSMMSGLVGSPDKVAVVDQPRGLDRFHLEGMNTWAMTLEAVRQGQCLSGPENPGLLFYKLIEEGVERCISRKAYLWSRSTF